jgi:hypothetical protein
MIDASITLFAHFRGNNKVGDLVAMLGHGE